MTVPAKKKDDSFTLIKKDDRYEKLEKYLSPSSEDTAHAIAEGTISSIPGMGGFLASMFGRFWESPLEKRKRSILVSYAMRLDSLEMNFGLNLEALRNDDDFFDIILHSLEIGLRNSQKEKLVYLQNMILNSALKIDIENDQKMMFLHYIDELTITHVKLLQFFDSNSEKLQKIVETDGHRSRNLHQFFRESFPELEGKMKPYLRDLTNRSLLHFEEMFSGNIALNIIKNGLLTEPGKQFLRFIKNPDLEKF